MSQTFYFRNRRINEFLFCESWFYCHYKNQIHVGKDFLNASNRGGWIKSTPCHNPIRFNGCYSAIKESTSLYLNSNNLYKWFSCLDKCSDEFLRAINHKVNIHHWGI